MSGLIGTRGDGVCYDRNRRPFWVERGIEVPTDATADTIRELVTPWEPYLDEAICYSDGTKLSTQAVRRTDTHAIIGEVGQDYKPISNKAMWDLLVNSAKEADLDVETAGTLFGGKRVWVMAKATDFEIVPGDRIKRYVFLANSHDGSTRFSGGPTDTRILCENTFALAVSQSLISVKHTLNAMYEVRQAAQHIGLMLKQAEHVTEQYQELAACHISPDEIDDVLFKLWPTKQVEQEEEPVLTKQAEGHHEAVKELLAVSPACNSPEIQGTAWSLFNAVTEHVDWGKVRAPQGEYSSDRRWLNLVEGQAAKTKAEAFQYVYALT